MFLIEKFAAETPKEVQASLEALVVEIYGRRPEWLDYAPRESYRFQGREFIRMDCAAGSVHGQLSMRASSGEGITRDILETGAREGRGCAWLVHRGNKSEHDSHEVERVG